MRDFYRHCRTTTHQSKQQPTASTTATSTTTVDTATIATTTGTATDDASSTTPTRDEATNKGKKAKTVRSGSGSGLGCAFSNFTVITMNVASNEDSSTDRGGSTAGNSGGDRDDDGIGAGNGLCGVSVLQQQHSLQQSHVQVTCHQGKQVGLANPLSTHYPISNPIST